MKKTYGYAQVSTREQHLDRQIKALMDCGIDEREIITDKAEGIAAAKERGAHLGRPVTAYPADWDEVYKHWRSGELTAVAAMHELGLKRSTFYKLVRRYEEGRE